MKASVSAALPNALQTLIRARIRANVSSEAGKEGEFHFRSGQSEARLIPEVTDVARQKMQWIQGWGRVSQPGTAASRSIPRSRR